MNETKGRPIVVTLCGSTRFKEQFVESNLRETVAGRIVLTIGCDRRTDEELFGELAGGDSDALKARLDVLHFAKIDLSDEVLILNCDDYIGDSTRRELFYARMRGKRIRWLEKSRHALPGETSEEHGR
jgi:hypothetical protein